MATNLRSAPLIIRIPRWLAGPSPAVPAPERRNAILSAWLTLSVLVGTLFALAFAPSNIPSVVGFLVFLVAYIASRTRYYRAAPWIVGVAFGIVPFLVNTMRTSPPDSNQVAVGLTWLMLPLLYAAAVLPLRSVLILTAGYVVAAWTMPFYSTVSFADVSQGASYLLIVGGLVLIVTNHRRLLENDRQANLQFMIEALRESEARLEFRVEERTRELNQAKEAAERANRIKSQFLASMSHELRTPLNAILNFTELTALGVAGPVNEQQKDLLSRSLDSGRHLLGLINDVLDISKMQSEQLTLFIEEGIDLRPEIDSAVEATRGVLSGKPVQIEVLLPGDLAPVAGDRRRIRQVLLNLMSNAAKFTDEGLISLTVQQSEAETRFVLRDSGPGIPADQHELIFQPFIQTATGIKHAGGTGLGLPISRHLVETHGGKLWAESNPGEGAVFTFTLPRQLPRPVAAAESA